MVFLSHKNGKVRKMNIRKRLMAIIMSLTMVLTYMPALAFAEDGTSTEQGEGFVSADLADSDDLLMQYFENQVDAGISNAKAPSGLRKARNATRYSQLNDSEKSIYDGLKAHFEKIASGEEFSTEFSISIEMPKEYMQTETLNIGGVDTQVNVISAESLGIDHVCEYTAEYDSWDLSSEAIAVLFNLDKVIDALLFDLPYDCYWFDKTEGYFYLYNALYPVDGSTTSDLYFDGAALNAEFSFCIAYAYRNNPDDVNDFTLDTAKTSATTAAVDTASGIINSYKDSSDLEKLNAYKAEICDLTAYDEDAVVDPENNKFYGDPWQMIYVFAGKPVVCEGYAKAFQFLCDKTSFKKKDIECHTVSGIMNGGTGEGGHMWNILHMDDGCNYMADITNSDKESIGEDGGLFISPAMEGGSVDSRYDFNVYDLDGEVEATSDIYYTYDPETRGIYGEDELTLSTQEYEEPDTFVPDLYAAASDGAVYNEENSTLTIEPGDKVFVSFLTGGEENLDHGYAPVAGFNEPCDEQGNPITDEAGVPLGDLSKAGFKVIHGPAGTEYSSTNEKLTEDAYGIIIDTEGLEAGTSADLSYYLYKYEGEDFWSYFESDEFEWTDMEVARTQKLTVKVAHKAALTKTDAVAATCTTAGNTEYWHCDGCGKYFSDAEGKTEIAESGWMIAALGHDYQFSKMEWSKANDGYAAKALYVCSHNAGHTTSYDASVTSATTPATCDKDGQVVYTASYDGHTETKTDTIAKLGHTFGPWKSDGDSQHKRICANDPSHFETGAHEWDAGTDSWPNGEDESGVKTYKCNVCGATMTVPLKGKLEEAKDAAVAELVKININDYSGAEKANVEAAIAKGKEEIANAQTIDAVNEAKTAALSTIKAQKTDAQKSAEMVVPAAPATPSAPAEIIDLPAVKISKPAAAKKKITVKWKKVSKKNLKKISGIQIQVATDPDFTNIVKTATAGKKKTSKAIKGLQPKTKYYVRIRAYAPGDHYSVWKNKSAKVK